MEKEIKTKVANGVKKVAVMAATYYANVACPFVTYQPQMSKGVKKLRKF